VNETVGFLEDELIGVGEAFELPELCRIGIAIADGNNEDDESGAADWGWTRGLEADDCA
jgi:hypothetical protein